MGGSAGHISRAIALQVPKLSFVVQDQADVVAKGAAESGELASRFTFMVHDFFTPNPVKPGEANVFFLRFILHDWPFDESVRILKNIVPSMIPNKTKIVVCDCVVPEPGEVGYMEERAFRWLDMQMMTVLNSAERTIADWQALFDAVGLRIVKRSKPPGSMLSLIELMLVE